MCPGTLAEEKKDGREDEEGKDGGGGGGSFGGDGALLFMGVESMKETTHSIVALFLAQIREDCGWIFSFRKEDAGDGLRGRALVPTAWDLAAGFWRRSHGRESVFPTSVRLFAPGRCEPNPQSAFWRRTFTANVSLKSWWSGAGIALNLSVNKPSEVSFHKMSDH